MGATKIAGKAIGGDLGTTMIGATTPAMTMMTTTGEGTAPGRSIIGLDRAIPDCLHAAEKLSLDKEPTTHRITTSFLPTAQLGISISL